MTTSSCLESQNEEEQTRLINTARMQNEKVNVGYLGRWKECKVQKTVPSLKIIIGGPLVFGRETSANSLPPWGISVNIMNFAHCLCVAHTFHVPASNICAKLNLFSPWRFKPLFTSSKSKSRNPTVT